MTGYTVAHLDEIDEVEHRGSRLRPVRHHLGITAFGVNAWTAREAGERLIPEHTEDDGNEELYVVQQGHATFELDAERLDAPAGTLVSVAPAVKRTAFAEEPGTTILAIGGVRGEAFVPGGWEVWSPLQRLYEAGEYAEAADDGRELIETGARYPAVVYNVACCESLAGRTPDAVEHLRQAIGLHEPLRDLAKEDSDFDAIREEPAFKELVEA